MLSIIHKSMLTRLCYINVNAEKIAGLPVLPVFSQSFGLKANVPCQIKRISYTIKVYIYLKDLFTGFLRL